MISLLLNRYTFTFRLIPSLIMIVLMALFIRLGFWQLDRAHQKSELLKQYHSAQQSTPKQLSSSMTIDKNKQYTPLKIMGHYDNQHTFLLDNRFYQHRVGYEVLTPFILPNDSKKVLLVNRGWIPSGRSRNQRPTIAAIKNSLTLQGLIIFPSHKSFVLNQREEKGETWPRVLQALDLQKIEMLLKKPLYPFVLRLKPNQQGVFASNWRPVILRPQKHSGYAVQWFALAVAALVLLLVVNIEAG